MRPGRRTPDLQSVILGCQDTSVSVGRHHQSLNVVLCSPPSNYYCSCFLLVSPIAESVRIGILPDRHNCCFFIIIV
jgi:hypothetical protein